MNFEWKRQTGEFASGESLWLNGIKLGGYYWNPARARGDDSNQYSGCLDLPSLREPRLYADNPSEMRIKLEKQAREWFKIAFGDKNESPR